MESQPSIPNPTTKAIPEDPLRKPLRDMPPWKTPFRALRRVPRVPEARPRNPFGAFPKPAERPLSKPPSDHPSEHATCPESQPGSHPFETSFENPFGLSFGECHASRVIDREKCSREGCERATCPECRSQDKPPLDA